MLRRHSVQVLIVAERKAAQPYTQAMDYSEAVAWLLGMTNFERAVAPSHLQEGDDATRPSRPAAGIWTVCMSCCAAWEILTSAP